MIQTLAETVVFNPPGWSGFSQLTAWFAIGVEFLLLGRELYKHKFAHLAYLAGSLFAVCLASWVAQTNSQFAPFFALGIIAGWRIICAYRKTTRKISLLTKALLILPKLLIVAIAIAWLFNPQAVSVSYQDQPGVVLVGVDTSLSMARKDMPENISKPSLASYDKPISRIEAVRKALRQNHKLIKSLREKNLKLRFFQFSDKLTAPPSQVAPASWSRKIHTPAALSTAIGTSLSSAVKPITGAGENLHAVIVLTDGCNNRTGKTSPTDFARLLADQRIKLYPVLVGSTYITEVAKALSVRSVGAPDSITAFSTMQINPVISAVGLAGKKIKVTAHMDKIKIGETVCDITKKRWRRELNFTHIPLKPGFHRLTITAQPVGFAGSKLAGNFSQSKLVQVTNHELRILYIEGKFRYETKYITRALGSSGRIKLDRRILLRPLGESAGLPIGEDKNAWLGYNAIILGDVSADQFTPRQLEILKDLVTKHGKGLCMIGGGKSFGRGGWQHTPLAEIMPISLARSVGEITTAIRPLPTSAGKRSSLMKISDKMSVEKAWQSLDEMPGANKLLGAKPAASILAKTKAGDLMIVTQRAGAGRTVAIAFDTTWRWVLSPNELDTEKMQKRFWRQLALFLCAPKATAWITSDKTLYDLADLSKGAPVEISAVVSNSQGIFADKSAKVFATIARGDSPPKQIKLSRTSEDYRAELRDLKKPGVYTVKLDASVDGQKISSLHKFEIVRRDRESSQLLANANLLEALARQTGTELTRLNDFTKLIQKIKTDYRTPKKKIIHTRSCYENYRWWFVTAIILLFLCEWLVRRKKGLV